MIENQNNPPINQCAPNLPKVVFWYKLYCGLMTFLYLALIVVGIILIIFHKSIEPNDPMGMLMGGIMYVVIGFTLAIPFIISFFLPRKSWVWIYHLVLICLGLASCCCMPVTIPLLIFWISPETKAYFSQ